MCKCNQQAYNCVDCQEKKEQRDHEEAIANGARYETFRDTPNISAGLIELLILAAMEIWEAMKRDTESKKGEDER